MYQGFCNKIKRDLPVSFVFLLVAFLFLSFPYSLTVVEAESIQKVQIQSVSADVGETVEFGTPIRWTVKGEGEAVRYAWYIYKDSKHVKTVGYSSKAILDWTPAEAGDYRVRVYAKDSSGNVDAISSTTIQVKEFRRAEIHNVASSTSGTTLAGSSIRWTVDGQGTGVRYAWYIYKDGRHVETIGYSSKTALNWTPAIAGDYIVRVYAKDSRGNVDIMSSNEKIVSNSVIPVNIRSVSASTSGISAGNPIQWTVKGEGTGVRYAWYIYKDGQHVKTVGYSSKTTLDWTPATAGDYHVRVYAKDSNGKIDIESSNVIAVTKPVPVANILNVSASASGFVEKGTPIRWTVKGEGTEVRYAWYIYDGGQHVKTVGYSSKTTLDWTPATAGDYRVRVYAKDNKGNIDVESTEVINVTNLYTPANIQSVTTDVSGVAQAGFPIQWTAEGEGTGVRYAWYIYKEGARIGTVSYSTNPSVNWTPSAAGNYRVKAYAKDERGNTSSMYSDTVQVTEPSFDSARIYEHKDYNYTFDEMVDIQMTKGPKADGAGKILASRDLVEYYVNPVNFDKGSNDYLQFLALSKSAGLNTMEVNEKVLKGKGILAGTAAAFIQAGKQYNINEVYLMAHALHETGNGTSTLATGVTVNGKTVYNMYGIAAYDDTPVESGSKYAYEQGWFTPEAAIIGGAQFVSKNYIHAGQDTLYKMRWNPDNPGTHQYATDAGWAVKQTSFISRIYNSISGYVLNFEVPRYSSQPAAEDKPTTDESQVATAYPNGIVGKVTTGLNFRTGPSTNYSLITTLTAGTTVNVLGVDANGWYKITVNGEQGWVYGTYVDLVNLIEIVNLVNGDNLNVRSSAPSGTVIGSLQNKELVAGVLDSNGNLVTSDNWYHIHFGTGQAWIYGGYATEK